MSVATAIVRRTSTATTVKKKKDDFNDFPDITNWSDEDFLSAMIGRILCDDELRPYLQYDSTMLTENKLMIEF